MAFNKEDKIIINFYDKTQTMVQLGTLILYQVLV